MKYLTVLIINLFWLQYGYSQIHEIGVFFGGSNIIGDIGSTNYISPNEIAFGGIYKWNRSPRHSWRLSAIKTDLSAYDSKSDDPRRKERNWQFNEKTILEGSVGIEFNFIDFDLHKTNRAHTPYIYTGLSAAYQRDFYFNNTGNTQLLGTKSFIMGIPITLGYKYRFTHAFIIAAEIGARYTFSDALDGSLPADAQYDHFKFGNTNNNDWYTFTGITLTYTFGRNPCYCVN